MKGRLVSCETYIEIDDQMVFPNPTSEIINNIEWRFRHDPTSANKSDLIFAASVISAYKAIVCNKTNDNRTAICSAIKKTIIEGK